jgi:hypothetical protein
MKIKLVQITLSLTIGLLLGGCSGSLKTTGKVEPGVTLDNYHTYAWVAPHNPEDKARVDDKRYAPLIRRLSDEALQKKGMRLDTIAPDALFSFDTRVEERVKYSKAALSNPTYYYGGAGYYPGFYVGPAYYENTAPIPGGEVLPEEYDQGMLSIQMFDTKSKKILWRGFAEKPLTANTNAEATIKAAVKNVFIQLPVKHKK